MSKPKDGIELVTEAVKQVIKANGDISLEKFPAKILASETHGTISIMLQSLPKIGICVTLEDIRKVLSKDVEAKPFESGN